MNAAAANFAYAKPATLVPDFASRGLVALAPGDLGIPRSVHATIYEKEKAAFAAKRRIAADAIPEILDVITAPGVVAACNTLLGRNWAIVPFTHNTPFMSGARDQHWHKDDNGPYNMRRHRHHHAVQVEMLYYPQAVAEDMGPTAVVPYSQYWTFNHEENNDNFAGADHLDFGYQLNGMERLAASGPDCRYDQADVVGRRTPHDVRMREAIEKTGWPLVAQLEIAPLEAGTVVLYSHNLFHRGNHRRDDWRTWRERPRFMWRFWLYRTTAPESEGEPHEIDWRRQGVDPMTGFDHASLTDDVTELWRHHHHWMRSGRPPRADRTDALPKLAQDLSAWHESGEPKRLGAGYKLAAHRKREAALRILDSALRDEREAVRRAALYGLIAVGPDAAPVLVGAAASAAKWVRRAAMCGLGDAAMLTRPVLDAVCGRLRDDASVYVRSVAATALGGLGSRAIGTGDGKALVPDCVEALIASLDREQNRLGMNIAQDRSIKFVRPTDLCDVCEGIGIDYGVDRFGRVRSVVRENALTSLVILCSHGIAVLGPSTERLIDALVRVVESDRNVFSVGLALDALVRLARADDFSRTGLAAERTRLQTTLDRLLGDLPIHSWEAFVASGIGGDAITRHLPARDAAAGTVVARGFVMLDCLAHEGSHGNHLRPAVGRKVDDPRRR